MAEGLQQENDTPLSNSPFENMSWDYIYKTFKKPELQKHCRTLGINKVWMTKDKLVDAIVNSQRSTWRKENPTDPIEKLQGEIEDLRKKVTMKDNEIEELNTVIKSTQVIINRLNDRMSALEKQVKMGERNIMRPQEPTSVTTPERSLLIGDSNLNEAFPSDLSEHCKIRTIHEATMDLLSCWIEEKLDWTPDRCFIYCGIQDLIENVSPEVVLDNLGSVITILKSKKDAMRISVCELAPVPENEELNCRINQYNTKLESWAKENGIVVILTNLSFKTAHGEIEELCYVTDSESGCVNFNRYGVLKLMSIINKIDKSLELSGEWKNIFSQTNTQRKNTGTHSDMREYTQKYNRRPSVLNNVEYDRGNRNDNFNLNYDENRKYYINQQKSDEHRYRNNVYSQRPPRIEQRNSHETFSFRRNGPQRKGCFNCGEFNHRQSNCRYDHKVRCGSCGTYGHKERLCHRYNH